MTERTDGGYDPQEPETAAISRLIERLRAASHTHGICDRVPALLVEAADALTRVQQARATEEKDDLSLPLVSVGWWICPRCGAQSVRPDYCDRCGANKPRASAEKAVTRFKVIDHRLPAGESGVDTGRVYGARDCHIELSYQDDGKMLKVFVKGTRSEDDSWSVSVERNGENIVNIGHNSLSGRDLEDGDEETIRAAAHHLLGFIGDPSPRSPEPERDAFAEAVAAHPPPFERAQEPGWQPIETAPKDAVLVYRPNMRGSDRIAIRRVNDWCGPRCCPNAEPTHWMPLPASPRSPEPRQGTDAVTRTGESK